MKTVLQDKEWFLIRSGKGRFHGAMRAWNDRSHSVGLYVKTWCGKNVDAKRAREAADRERVDCKQCRKQIA